ncbi:transporter substrate-binding domain-containing protein [Cupriavidus necator]|uniref:transporter substrate-binding domain-containing protein n=1 Tax=Cupriavidus necator TaxID=106590 RepID=UPI0027894893|nr:transporter substrate-binding domain-containing protein [Cupriavidus necator]MDQ0140717.1 polar amino acid transport system substrate-binding protein [Cupriavidus necator]
MFEKKLPSGTPTLIRPVFANRFQKDSVLRKGRGGSDGNAAGVSVDLANALAERLGVPLELVVVDAAGKSVDVVTNEDADVGFFAIDPKRMIAFTAPYVLIEGYYLVRDNSPVRINADVDRFGTRVVVGKGSAYDLYLIRELQQAEIVRSPTSPTVVEMFREENLDVAAGVRQQLEADIAGIPGYRLLNERFMVIRQAMGLPKSRGEHAVAFLKQLVEEVKRSGFVAEALKRHGIQGATVAPLENA